VIERPIVGEARTPDGTRAVMFADTWRDHILDPTSSAWRSSTLAGGSNVTAT
jgi:hypothetical protein